MKRNIRFLCGAFFLTFLLLLIFGSLQMGVLFALPGLSGAVLLILIALAGSVLLAVLLRRLLFSFHKSAQLLPREMSSALEDQLPADQFRLLCQAYTKKYEEFSVISVDRFLLRLLEDNSHTRVIENLDQQITEVLHSEAFGYRWTSYCLVYVRLEDYDSYMLKNCDGHLLFSDFRRMYDVVSHAFTATLNEHHIARGVEWKNACVYLVNLAGSTPDTPRADLERAIDGLCHGCEETAQRIGDSFNVTLETVVSIPFRDPTETHSIFEWMLTMKAYSDFVSGPRVVLSPADCEQFHTPSPGSPATAKTYYSALLAEDFPRAEQTLFELILCELANNGYSVPDLKNQVLILLNAAEDIATSNSISTESIASTDWRSDVQSAETREQLDQTIHSFFQYLISRSGKRRHECSSTAKKIIAFLDENFTCPDLSVTMLSDSLSLSPSYISRIFKRETGQNVPDYIHAKRVKLAKELLASTELSINDIAVQVGYSTAWTMNRIFKRLVNMTPGAWRQVAQSRRQEVPT